MNKEEAVVDDYQHHLITADLHPIMSTWGRQNGFIVPDSRWFAFNHHLVTYGGREYLKYESITV